MDTQLQGKVEALITNIEEMSTQEELERELKEQKENREKLEREAEEMKTRNEVEVEKLRVRELELSIKQMKEAREKAKATHEGKLQELKTAAQKLETEAKEEADKWVAEQIQKLKGEVGQKPEDEEKNRLEREKQNKIEDLRKQLQELTGEEPKDTCNPKADQHILLQQLKAALEPQPVDPKKDVLRALITDSNKAQGPGGTSTLKPDILARLTGENPVEMQEWLAQLNQQEEGEYLVSSREWELENRGAVGTKLRSGMLDKSTTNIKVKQIWPQKNLGEDWAEDELDYKQIKFEHLVAGETRTIETCTEPAQILGRLKLLRRIAYLRLRGFEWYLLRRMYAAILGSIETGENSWKTNFDRFETILYRRMQTEPRKQERPRERPADPQGSKKWYCRDWNREGCSKTPPHQAWFGSGSTAVKRMVIHACAACLLKERTVRDHQENHPECPNRD